MTFHFRRAGARPRTLTALLGAALLAGCATDTIVAQRIVLVDAAGEPRVFLGASDEGTGLLVYDEAGRIRAGLTLVGDSAELALDDADGELRLVLAARPEQTTLLLRDSEGRDRLVGRVDDALGPRLSLLAPQGEPVFSKP